ncbi:PucR family transcriptional regulator [[Clostridium] colinum]|uniref:PucR family transcriptional regulator n=1 Tax=[Clostridium] colinum TaxID=36835 RepID=UPI00202567CD|nr:helix-turn-helix domain-containing protein [[Clostridium] colinum]
MLKNNLSNFASSYKDIIKIGIGNSTNLENINISYKNSNIAISYIKENINFKFYDDFSLEILLNSISKDLKEKYINNVINNLSKDEINLLKIYFENNMELKNTANTLFIHINTLQYKLDKIHKKIGFNPRLFKDANFLYILINLL